LLGQVLLDHVHDLEDLLVGRAEDPDERGRLAIVQRKQIGVLEAVPYGGDLVQPECRPAARSAHDDLAKIFRRVVLALDANQDLLVTGVHSAAR